MRSDVVVSKVSEACADFTVLYCLMRHKDDLFAAWYDAKHRLTVGRRHDAQQNWEIFQPEGFWIEARQRYAHITEYDSHNYLSMAIDSDGYIHLSGNMHVDPLIYFRSERPLDVTSLKCVTAMTGAREARATYPHFFKDHLGRLLFRYRDGCSGNGDDIYNIYDTDQKRWARLLETPLLNGEGLRNGYARPPVAGPDGYWHMIWMWRESPRCETNNNLSYARSRDLLHWETSAGDSLELPITRDTGEIVDAVEPGGGLINMVQEVGFDNRGRALLIYHRYDEKGLSQAYLARADGVGGWQKRQLSRWNFRWDFQGPGSIPPDLTLGAPRAIGDGKLEVLWESVCAGRGSWIIDENTLSVLETRPPRHMLPLELLTLTQNVHPQAEVQIVAGQNSDYSPQDRYWLRWESLPIFRDLPHSVAVGSTTLELLDLS